MILLNGFGTLGIAPEESPTGIYELSVTANGFSTTLRPVNVRPAIASAVPDAVIEALNYWFDQDYHNARWVEGGVIRASFRDDSGQSGVRRDAALRQAIVRAEQSLGGGVRLLLPGEQLPTPEAPPAPGGETTDGGETPARSGPPAAQRQRQQSSEMFSTPVVVALVVGAAALGAFYYYQRRKPASAGVDHSV